MSKTILIAGATGNLGGKITNELANKGATVRAIVRKETSRDNIERLKVKGIEVIAVNMNSSIEIADACSQVSCVVSALSGLREVIIDTQRHLLDGAVLAGVKRFIPSDYSMDFTNLKPGENRNLDLRREFHRFVDRSEIKATTIFNGVFMDLLAGDMPLIIKKIKRVLYWGDPSVPMDMTTTDNIAKYTAFAALDDDTPRYLRIAGDTVSAKDMVPLMLDVTGEKFKLFRAGSIKRLNTFIKIGRFFSGDTKELYPAWQGMQYMRDMMEGKAVLKHHDNDRYTMQWTPVREFIKQN